MSKITIEIDENYYAEYSAVPKQQYEKLKEIELLLRYLQAGGVANWDGYEEALKRCQNQLHKREET